MLLHYWLHALIFSHVVQADADSHVLYQDQCDVTDDRQVCKLEFCTGNSVQINGLDNFSPPHIPRIFRDYVGARCNIMTVPYRVEQNRFACQAGLELDHLTPSYSYQVNCKRLNVDA